MEITAVARPSSRNTTRQGFALWMAGATRIGEIDFHDAADLVSKVIDKTLVEPNFNGIDCLNVVTHGNDHAIAFGSSIITLRSFPRYEQDLSRLTRLFARNGFVHFQACDVGSDYELIKQFARVWRVAVVAPTTTYNLVLRVQAPWGDYVRCEPAGFCRVGVPRP